jgi:hypothetical protein
VSSRVNLGTKASASAKALHAFGTSGRSLRITAKASRGGLVQRLHLVLGGGRWRGRAIGPAGDGNE